ncbi:MAG: DMT family transporter, partial [Planctomycetota bacterium]
MKARVALATAVTLVLWGSAFAGIRAVGEHYPPGEMALLRFALASLALVPVALLGRIGLPRRAELPRLVLIGLLGYAVYHTALNFGERTVTAGAASFIVNLCPVFTALLGLLLLGERVRPLGWAGMALRLGGVGLIYVGEGGEGLLKPGVLAVLVSAIAAAFYFVLQKPLLRKHGVLFVTCYSMWFGTAAMLVFLPRLPGVVAAAPARATLTVVYLAIFPAALAYLTW